MDPVLPKFSINPFCEIALEVCLSGSASVPLFDTAAAPSRHSPSPRALQQRAPLYRRRVCLPRTGSCAAEREGHRETGGSSLYRASSGQGVYGSREPQHDTHSNMCTGTGHCGSSCMSSLCMSVPYSHHMAISVVSMCVCVCVCVCVCLSVTHTYRSPSYQR